MLGSVARKLRIFGFDTVYMVHAGDDEVLKRGIEQGRIIVTADKELYRRIVKEGARGVLVEGASDLDDMAHIFAKLGLRVDASAIGSRCTACNGTLEGKTRPQVEGIVPSSVLERHDEFYQCLSCSKVYWDGGHMGRMRAFAEKLAARLSKG